MGISSSILYRTIDQLPLDRFISCICDSDLSHLIISGTATQDELEHTWGRIYEQYIDAIQDKEQMYILKVSGQINAMELDLKIIQLCVRRLEQQYSEEIVKELRKVLPTVGSFNQDDIEQYRKSLSLAITRSKALILQIETKKGELAKLMPKHPGDRVDRKYFDTVLVKLSKHMQFRVDRSKISVSEFTQMIVDMREAAQQLELELANFKK